MYFIVFVDCNFVLQSSDSVSELRVLRGIFAGRNSLGSGQGDRRGDRDPVRL
jgi:hypothetical protein